MRFAAPENARDPTRASMPSSPRIRQALAGLNLDCPGEALGTSPRIRCAVPKAGPARALTAWASPEHLKGKLGL